MGHQQVFDTRDNPRRWSKNYRLIDLTLRNLHLPYFIFKISFLKIFMYLRVSEHVSKWGLQGEKKGERDKQTLN